MGSGRGWKFILAATRKSSTGRSIPSPRLRGAAGFAAASDDGVGCNPRSLGGTLAGVAGETPVGFTWSDYIEGLVSQSGSLTAIAERLAATRSYEDDVGSIERALRRLRGRGLQPGGKWGQALLTTFGLPTSVQARLRWMAAYHSRFSDLPVALCEDLVRLWDHPPTTERRESRTWLALARMSIALRRNDYRTACALLEQAQCDLGPTALVETQIETLLVQAFIASKLEPARVPELLASVEPKLALVQAEDERACLHVRWTDQQAYDLNKGRDTPPNPSGAEALYLRVPAANVPPFVLCRRANGLAYARWKQGHANEAASLAREAARHAGDGGHVRLRIMALGLLARIDPSEAASHERALEMSKRLEDELLLARMAPEASRGS